MLAECYSNAEVIFSLIVKHGQESLNIISVKDIVQNVIRYAGANAWDEARPGRGGPWTGPAPLPAELIWRKWWRGVKVFGEIEILKKVKKISTIWKSSIKVFNDSKIFNDVRVFNKGKILMILKFSSVLKFSWG